MGKILLSWSSKHSLTTILLPGFSSFTVSTSVWGQQSQDGFYGSHMMWNGGWWYGMFFGPILMVVFIGIVIAVVVLLVKWLGGSTLGVGSPNPSAKCPLDILKERFARGEIDKDGYEERRKVLRE